MSEGIEKHERQLSVRELERAIFLSFMHSQGKTDLQMVIVAWMRAWYGRQNKEAFEEAYSRFCNSRFDKQDEFTLAQKNLHTENAPVEDPTEPIRERKIDRALVEEQRRFISGFFKESVMTIDNSLLQELLNDLIDKDYNYLHLGRPNRADSAKQHTIAHKYFSFFVTFVLRSEGTSDEALDALYAKLRSAMHNISPEMSRKIRVLSDEYTKRNANHSTLLE